jgi:hypothetical protein
MKPFTSLKHPSHEKPARPHFTRDGRRPDPGSHRCVLFRIRPLRASRLLRDWCRHDFRVPRAVRRRVVDPEESKRELDALLRMAAARDRSEPEIAPALADEITVNFLSTVGLDRQPSTLSLL